MAIDEKSMSLYEPTTDAITEPQYVAGRALDALVAEKVMGWTRHPDSWPPMYREPGDELRPPGSGYAVVPSYSTAIAAAWEVVEAMRLKFYRFLINGGIYDTNWGASFHANFASGDDYFHGYADTASLAICRAALKVVGVIDASA